MDKIAFNLSDENEMTCSIGIEGTDEVPQVVRLCVDGENIKYAFDGDRQDSGDYTFHLPKLAGRIAEGDAKGRIEVVVDDKYFVPLEMDMQFVGGVKVSAAIRTPSGSAVKQGIGVQATVKAAIAPEAEPEEKVDVKVQEKVAKNPLSVALRRNRSLFQS